MRYIYTLIMLLLSAYISSAQGGNTSITGQIKDHSGNLYTNSQVNIIFFDPGTSGKLPLLNGSTFQTTYTGYATDSNGNLPPISLPDNGNIGTSSGATGTQWVFSICFSDRQTCFQTKQTINCSLNLPATCTSNSINITAALQSASAPLPVVPQPASLTANNAFTGANTFSGGGSFRGMSTVNEVVYVCSKVAAYANQTIAAGITALSSNKGIIKVCDGHAETLTANLSIPGSAIIEFDGNATITQGAFQIIVAAGNDNVTIKSDFPISAHSNGTNSGVQFTGYTGTGAAVLLGASSAQTRNLKVENIGVSLASAGNGARCYEGDRLYEFKFHWDYCTIGSTATGNIGILLDGTGGFTGVGIIEGFNCSTGTSNNHVCLRGQNTVTRVVVEGGDYVNNSASGGVCWDANVAEFNFVNPNCNTASAGMLTVEGAGAHVTGTVSRDSTVTNPVVTFGAGTSGNYIFCATCAISDSTATNNGSFNTFLMNDGMIWQSNKWRAQCEATTCSFRDVTTGKAFVQSSTGGNLFLGNGTNQVTIANDDSINSFKFTTIGNCSSSASPAVCSSSAAGSVVVAAAATTVTVNTTAVTANSQILLTRDDSLGTKLSVTCNTATVMGEAKVSARVAGTSFTITVQTAPATNPGCFSYSIVN